MISKEEYQALVQEGAPGQKEDDAGKDPSTAQGDDKASSQTETATAKQSNLTEVGGQRKRKQAKVVGEKDPAEKPEKAETQEAQPKAPASRKPKKAKKIKLSFDEE